MPDRIIRRLNGPRGSVLLAGALIAAVHAIAYVDVGSAVSLPTGLAALSRVVPLAVYAVLWGVAAMLAGLGSWQTFARRQRDHFDAWGFGMVAGMLVIWGCTYLGGWFYAWVFQGDPNRQWVFAVLYLSVAVMIGASARMTNPGSAAPRQGVE